MFPPNAQVNPRLPRERRAKYQPNPPAADVGLNRLLGGSTERPHFCELLSRPADQIRHLAVTNFHYSITIICCDCHINREELTFNAFTRRVNGYGNRTTIRRICDTVQNKIAAFGLRNKGFEPTNADTAFQFIPIFNHLFKPTFSFRSDCTIEPPAILSDFTKSLRK